MKTTGSICGLRVSLTQDGFYPCSLRWQGRTVRVLCVEDMFTCGLERRYRLRTPEGRYEVGLDTGTGAWQMRRAPSWLHRLWMRIQDAPRYPVAPGRRRGRRRSAARRAFASQVSNVRPVRVIAVGR